MEESKSLKNELIIIAVCVVALLIITISFSYSYFMSVDKGKNNVISVGDLNVSFCIDETCKKDYANFGQVIGTKIVDGKSVIENIYPYDSDNEALLKDPYVFNIKNTGSLKTYVTIRLKEDKDYILSSEHENYTSLTKNYSDYIKVAISNCSNKIDRENAFIQKYSNLTDNILLSDEEFKSEEDKTYCLWTYLDSNTPNEVQNTYFVANLDFKAEYKPN